MVHASWEGRLESDDPEVIALWRKTAQEFLATHDVKAVYVHTGGLPVTGYEVQAELCLQRSLKVGGSHLDVLDGDDTLLSAIGLPEHLAVIVGQPGRYLPTDERRLAPLRTVNDLANCPAPTLMEGWPQLRRNRGTGSDDLAEIIRCLEVYAETRPARRAKSHPDLVTT
jgi:hypothetical protein